MSEIVRDMRKASSKFCIGLHAVMYLTRTLFHKNIKMNALTIMSAIVMVS